MKQISFPLAQRPVHHHTFLFYFFFRMALSPDRRSAYASSRKKKKREKLLAWRQPSSATSLVLFHAVVCTAAQPSERKRKPREKLNRHRLDRNCMAPCWPVLVCIKLFFKANINARNAMVWMQNVSTVPRTTAV